MNWLWYFIGAIYTIQSATYWTGCTGQTWNQEQENYNKYQSLLHLFYSILFCSKAKKKQISYVFQSFFVVFFSSIPFSRNIRKFLFFLFQQKMHCNHCATPFFFLLLFGDLLLIALKFVINWMEFVDNI